MSLNMFLGGSKRDRDSATAYSKCVSTSLVLFWVWDWGYQITANRWNEMVNGVIFHSLSACISLSFSFSLSHFLFLYLSQEWVRRCCRCCWLLWCRGRCWECTTQKERTPAWTPIIMTSWHTAPRLPPMLLYRTQYNYWTHNYTTGHTISTIRLLIKQVIHITRLL